MALRRDIPPMRNVKRLNRWYGRTLQTLTGDWVLTAGWWHWREHDV